MSQKPKSFCEIENFWDEQQSLIVGILKTFSFHYTKKIKIEINKGDFFD